MNNPWFGPPWPSDDRRAPICEDDADRIPTPVGEVCDLCDEPILEGERGTGMPYSAAPPETPRMVYQHHECGLRTIVGCSAGLRGELHDHSQYAVPGWLRQDALAVAQILHDRWETTDPRWDDQ